MKSLSFRLVAGLVLGLVANATAAQSATDPWAALPQYQFGQSREPLANIEELIRKASPAERAAIETRLLEALRSPAATKDSRRFICRWLGLVGSEKSVPSLAALLADPDLSHPARMGLEALPDASSGKALVDALPKVQGNLLVGVIASLGAKRAESAVPELTRLLQSPDPAVARAALSALGRIGTGPAAKALASARVDSALERDRARARVDAATRLTETGRRSEAADVFKSLMEQPGQEPAIRIAAFQGLAGTLPTMDAAALIVNALEGEDPVLQPAAAKAFANSGEARAAVATKLPAMQPKGQLLLMGILGDAPEVAARKPLLQVLDSAADPAVKAAAVEALAVHGRAEDVPLLAKMAAAGEEPVKLAARRTLQRIAGPGVDAAFMRAIETGEAGPRKAAMEALPSRRMEAALPALVRLAQGQDAALAVDATRTLGYMGGAAQIKDLAQVLTSARTDSLRGTAQEAIKTICTRVEDKSACASILEAELARAAAPEARTALLPLTVYTGGAAALDQVLKGMADANADVRASAFRTLVAWPEAAASPHLLRFAETNAESTQAIVALRDGCLRLAEMEEISASQRANILRDVARVARRPEERKRAVSLMSQVPSLELLEFLPRLAADAALRPEATASAIQVARNLAAVYPRQAQAALDDLARLADTAELKQAVENGRKAVRNSGQSSEGFIVGWMISGPYRDADKKGAALFDAEFAPEKAGTNPEWRPFTAPQDGMVDLSKLMPGDDRVAYLKATVVSEQDQKALLELGSDDGVKVWLNGQVVHANNTARPCTPGEDKVNLTLKPGDNTLLLKITQGGGGFAAVARLRDADGKPLSNVMIGAAR